MQSILRFLRSEDGPTAVEYAVMLALIVAACLTTIAMVGTETRDSFNGTANAVNNAMSGN